MFVHVRTRVCMHAHNYVWMYVCVVSGGTCTHYGIISVPHTTVCVFVYVHAYVCLFTYGHVYVCMHVIICMYVCMCCRRRYAHYGILFPILQVWVFVCVHACVIIIYVCMFVCVVGGGTCTMVV